MYSWTSVSHMDHFANRSAGEGTPGAGDLVFPINCGVAQTCVCLRLAVAKP